MCKRIFVLAIIVSIFNAVHGQDWTGGNLNIDSPAGLPYGINMDLNLQGGWAREFSFSRNGASTGKLLSFGAYGGNQGLKYGYIGGNTSSFTAHSNPWMTFLPSGKIGINTTTPGNGANPSPDVKLQVSGDITLNGGFRLTLDNADYKNAYLQFSSALLNARFLHFSQYGHRFEDNEGVSMVIEQGGNVGIGVEDPTQKFEVNGRMKLHETTDGAGVWMSNAAVGSWFTGLTNTGAWRVYNDNIGNTMTITPEGKMGIGTTTPGAGLAPAANLKLQVNGDVTLHKGDKLAFDDNYYVHAYLSYDQIGADGTNHSTARFLHYGYYGQRFEDNGGVRMVIKQGGNIGIGVNDPTEKLEVNGGLKLGAAVNDTEGTISYEAGSFFITDATGKNALGATGGIGSNITLGDDNGQDGNLVLHDYQGGGYYGGYPNGYAAWNKALTIKNGSTGHELSIGTYAEGNFYIGKNSDNLDERAKSLAVNIPLIGSNEVRIGNAIGDNGIIKNGSLEYREGGFYGYLVDDVASKLLTENSEGYVGIGTNTPQANLHIAGMNHPSLVLEDNVNGNPGGPDYGDISISLKRSNSDYLIRNRYAPESGQGLQIIENDVDRYGMYLQIEKKMFFGKYADLSSLSGVGSLADFAVSGQGYFSGGVALGEAIHKKAGTIEFNGGEFYVYKEDGVATDLIGGGASVESPYVEYDDINDEIVLNNDELYSGGTLIKGKLAIGDIHNNTKMPNGIPDGYALAVAGDIIAQKVKVAYIGEEEWKDGVFAKDYDLLSISEVEEFIDINSHLPGVPSAEEVVRNGVELSEMTATLLGKVEELTLYIIEQEKRIKELESQLK